MKNPRHASAFKMLCIVLLLNDPNLNKKGGSKGRNFLYFLIIRHNTLTQLIT
jgi:hypothetical protein